MKNIAFNPILVISFFIIILLIIFNSNSSKQDDNDAMNAVTKYIAADSAEPSMAHNPSSDNNTYTQKLLIMKDDDTLQEIHAEPTHKPEYIYYVSGILKVSGEDNIAYPLGAQGDTSHIDLSVDAPASLSLGGTALVHVYPNIKTEGARIFSIRWSIVRRPKGSNVSLVNDSGLTAEFKPDVPGVYVLGVIMDSQSGVIPIMHEVFTGVLVK